MVTKEQFIATIDSIDRFYDTAESLRNLTNIDICDTPFYEVIVNLCQYLICSFTNDDDINRDILFWYLFDKRDGIKFYVNGSSVKINNAGELYDIINKRIEESD